MLVIEESHLPSHNLFIPTNCRACLGLMRSEIFHLICRFLDERKHCREGNIVLFEKVGCNAIKAIHEVATEHGSEMKIFATFAIHRFCFASHTFGKQSKQFEVFLLSSFYIKRHLLGRQFALLGDSLQGIKHASPLLRKHIHRHTSSRMDDQAVDFLKLLTYRDYRLVTYRNDIKVGILWNGALSLTSANMDYLERRLDVCP